MSGNKSMGLLAKARKKITLRQYYKTKHWIQLRNQLAFGDDAECEICHCKRWENYKVGKKKGLRKPKAVNHIHLHHKNYDNLMCEKREDLMLLCDSCHKFGHMIQKMSLRFPLYKDIYEAFKKQTGWEYKKR